jgi:hypothetical protein
MVFGRDVSFEKGRSQIARAEAYFRMARATLACVSLTVRPPRSAIWQSCLDIARIADPID